MNNGPGVHLKTVHESSLYIENAGRYMEETQTLATFFVLRPTW